MDEIRKKYNQYRLFHIPGFIFYNLVYFGVGYFLYIKHKLPEPKPGVQTIFLLLLGVCLFSFIFFIYLKKKMINNLMNSEGFQKRLNGIFPIAIILSAAGTTYSIYGLLLFILGIEIWKISFFFGAAVISQVIHYIRWDKWLELVSPDRP